jgi:hypothetical protein
MARFLQWLEAKSTRLRLFAGASVVLIWIFVVLMFLGAWFGGKDLNSNGGLTLLYAISGVLGSILGIHMATKPGSGK